MLALSSSLRIWGSGVQFPPSAPQNQGLKRYRRKQPAARANDRLNLAIPYRRQEIDRVFDDGYAAAHPEIVMAVMQTAASDFTALANRALIRHPTVLPNFDLDQSRKRG